MPASSPDGGLPGSQRPDRDSYLSLRPPRRRQRESAVGLPEQDRLILTALDALAGQLDFGVVVLGGNQRVVYANAAATKLLSSRRDLYVRRGALYTTHLEVAALLARPRTGRQGRSSWTYALGTGEDPILLHRPRLRRADDPAMLLLYETRRRRLVPASILRCIYGLTTAESDLTARLVAGDDLGQASESLQVSIHTVRTHLKKIFGKLEVRSQVDLVRLLLGGPLTPD